MKNIIIIGIIFLLSLVAVNAATVSHSAAEVNPGSFQVGNYYFPDGNVGIGTTTPLAKLEVNGSIQIPRDSYVGFASGANIISGMETERINTNDNRLHFITYDDGVSYGRRMTISENGNVGIGTTNPENRLNVKSAGTQTEPFKINASSGSGEIRVWENTVNELAIGIKDSSGAEKVYIRPDGNSYFNGGNVGIGTTSPSQEMDVVGDIVATSSLSQGTYLGLFKGLGSLPGYPTSLYPTLKTDHSYIYFSAGGAYSAHMSAGGVWTAISARDSKENFVEADSQEILTKIDLLPMYQWNFKGEDSSIKHIAPIAEDFHTLFGLNGDNDKMVSHIDPSGVALVGIKALSQEVKELKSENDALKQLVCQDHPTADICQ